VDLRQDLLLLRIRTVSNVAIVRVGILQQPSADLEGTGWAGLEKDRMRREGKGREGKGTDRMREGGHGMGLTWIL
jgi:hypothetical protein